MVFILTIFLIQLRPPARLPMEVIAARGLHRKFSKIPKCQTEEKHPWVDKKLKKELEKQSCQTASVMSLMQIQHRKRKIYRVRLLAIRTGLQYRLLGRGKGRKRGKLVPPKTGTKRLTSTIYKRTWVIQSQFTNYISSLCLFFSQGCGGV